jgi:hypothetical protein
MRSPLTRRDLLRSCTFGVGSIALAWLQQQRLVAEPIKPEERHAFDLAGHGGVAGTPGLLVGCAFDSSGKLRLIRHHRPGRGRTAPGIFANSALFQVNIVLLSAGRWGGARAWLRP